MGSNVPGRVRLGLGRRRLKSARSGAAIAAIALLLSCTPADSPDAPDAAGTEPSGVSTTVVDQAGRTHDFSTPATRIVSLVPSATATLRVLGSEALLVGRTDFDDAEWLAEVPSVGGGLEPNLEVLVSLQPDLVIRFEGAQDPTTPARLDELGIAHLGIRPVSLSDVYVTNRLIGAATGRQEAAEALSTSIRDGLEALRVRAEGEEQVSFAYTLGGTPPWVSGSETFVSEVIELVGGVNAFHDLDAPWSGVSREEFRVRDIDALILASPQADVGELSPGARVVVIGGVLDQPGPEIVQAATAVFDALHRPSGR